MRIRWNQWAKNTMDLARRSKDVKKALKLLCSLIGRRVTEESRNGKTGWKPTKDVWNGRISLNVHRSHEFPGSSICIEKTDALYIPLIKEISRIGFRQGFLIRESGHKFSVQWIPPGDTTEYSEEYSDTGQKLLLRKLVSV